MRKIVLDTETTGINSIDFDDNFFHRIIEIGAVEIIDRKITENYFHVYLNPEVKISDEAYKIHGINNSFLKNKPKFIQIVDKLFNFINESDIIMHNASFDINFINRELIIANYKFLNIEKYSTIIDSLLIARKLFPGKNNSIDALCKRYMINNPRLLHNALLDAKILANLFLLMTSSQTSIFDVKDRFEFNKLNKKINIKEKKQKLKIIYANEKELLLHEKKLNDIENKNGNCFWLQKNFKK